MFREKSDTNSLMTDCSKKRSDTNALITDCSKKRSCANALITDCSEKTSDTNALIQKVLFTSNELLRAQPCWLVLSNEGQKKVGS